MVVLGFRLQNGKLAAIIKLFNQKDEEITGAKTSFELHLKKTWEKCWNTQRENTGWEIIRKHFEASYTMLRSIQTRKKCSSG